MKRGKTVYEILRIIKNEDDSEKDADNGVHELYVNLEVPPIGNKELASLLRYIRHTIPENEDSCFSHIVNSVNACRKEGMNMKYYNSKEFYEEGVKDGMENSQNSIIRNMLTENVTPEQISQYTRISLERIHQVQKEMSQVVCKTNAYHTANKITSH
ncbi:MAG: hypothetical protein J1F02_01390 [Lachnospiraceae bacterium]|nr:hypothetical protein [Lachnospiraceae bacterium]